MTAIYKYLEPYIDRSIYAWGGQGENVCVQTYKGVLDPERWLKMMEATTSRPDANAERDIALYRQRIAQGINPVFCFDCSGLVVEMLIHFGIMKAGDDRNARGLYSMCNSHPVNKGELRYGDLVFYSKSKKASDISHIGIYLGEDNVCECRGRDYGVVVTDYYDKPSNWTDVWNMYGRLDALAPFAEDEPDIPTEPLPLDVTKPVHSGEGYKAMQTALNKLGYTDNDGVMLTEDGKWGKKSRAALDNMMALNLGSITAHVTLHISGIGDIDL